MLRGKFGGLKHTLAPLIKSAVMKVSSMKTSVFSPLEDFKGYLQRCFQELKPQLVAAESFENVLKIVEQKCTIINVGYLETIVEYYNIEEAKSHIADYKTAVTNFCEEVKLSVCKNENFMTDHSSSLLKCETIEFVLEWEIDKCTLKEIKDLLQVAFGSMAKRVLVKTVGESNSIIVTCYAPRNIMDVLLMESEKNLDLLKKMGLISLTIGYCTVWNVYTRDKVNSTRQ